jgi:molybdenum cofactor synthesis domain-containing protein
LALLGRRSRSYSQVAWFVVTSEGKKVSTRVGILTVSDRGYRGEYEDRSGPRIREIVTGRLDAAVELEAIVPDSQLIIQGTLTVWCDEVGLDLILTTGGTGFAPRDVTPEATLAVIEREAPGLVEAMRAASLRITPHAMLSRAVAGIRGSTLIVNLPGSPKAVRENLEVILTALPHGLRLIKGVEGEDRRHDLQMREV